MEQIHVRKNELDEDRRHIRSTPKFAPAGQSTQMVVGATNSTDRDIIQRADTLYRRFALRRIYYTGFSPYPKAVSASPSLRHPWFASIVSTRPTGSSATTASMPMRSPLPTIPISI